MATVADDLDMPVGQLRFKSIKRLTKSRRDRNNSGRRKVAAEGRTARAGKPGPGCAAFLCRGRERILFVKGMEVRLIEIYRNAEG
jgi:hypothetical protein